MNKTLAPQLINLLKNASSDIFSNREAIVDYVNTVLRPETLITENVKKEGMIGDAPNCRLKKNSISTMARFLKFHKEAVGPLESNRIGIEFAVEYLKALQDFAQKTNAEETVVSDINELLEALNK